MQRAALVALLYCPSVLLGACAPNLHPMSDGDGDGSGSGWPIEFHEYEGGGVEESTGDESTDDTTPAPGGPGSGAPGEDSSSGEGEDGCARLDLPDLDAHDDDGDGIDGTLCASVFVDPTVAYGGSGMTPADPLHSLAQAIQIAASYEPARDVLVVGGAFEESVELRGGVSLYGGYHHGFVTRNMGEPTVLIGTGPRAISAHGLEAPLTVQGFVVVGHDADEAGRSGYAVAIMDSAGAMVSFDRCVIMAGDGADGITGADGLVGGDGSDGAHGDDGGQGGASVCAVDGGGGAHAVMCPTIAAEAGAGPLQGDAGISAVADCSGVVCSDVPAAGQPGGDGSSGAHGYGAPFTNALGKLAPDGKWLVPSPAPAIAGEAGGGGGGGGAAGLDFDGPSCGVPQFANGGIGGGGGAAGCGGGAGQSGGAGGGSIAIVVVDSDVELRMTTIIRGAGGAGGDGGDGASGGRGGVGGAGRTGVGVEAKVAGDGGRGGDGGAGGGGAGGCAGSSIAIVQRGLSQLAQQQVAILEGSAGQPGAAGRGGATLGSVATSIDPRAGAPGCPGAVIDELAL